MPIKNNECLLLRKYFYTVKFKIDFKIKKQFKNSVCVISSTISISHCVACSPAMSETFFLSCHFNQWNSLSVSLPCGHVSYFTTCGARQSFKSFISLNISIVSFTPFIHPNGSWWNGMLFYCWCRGNCRQLLLFHHTFLHGVWMFPMKISHTRKEEKRRKKK